MSERRVTVSSSSADFRNTSCNSPLARHRRSAVVPRHGQGKPAPDLLSRNRRPTTGSSLLNLRAKPHCWACHHHLQEHLLNELTQTHGEYPPRRHKLGS